MLLLIHKKIKYILSDGLIIFILNCENKIYKNNESLQIPIIINRCIVPIRNSQL